MDRSLIGYPGRHSPGAGGPADLVAHIPDSSCLRKWEVHEMISREVALLEKNIHISQRALWLEDREWTGYDHLGCGAVTIFR